MKKLKISICLILALVLVCSTCTVFAEERSRMDKTPYADALNALGLFLGTDKGYELDAKLTREQAITLVVRFMGKEEAALAENHSHVFTDVSSWASPYVGYAYANGITNGVGATLFGAGDMVTEEQFMTFLLRMLGYVDDIDFTWQNPWSLANEAGLVPDSQPQSTPFTRGCAVVLCWRLLRGLPADGGKLLYERLISDNIFTQKLWDEAKALAGESVEDDADSDGGYVYPGYEDIIFPGITPGPGGSDAGGESGGDTGNSSDNNETEDVLIPLS